MLDRLLPVEVVRGHWRGLSDYRTDTVTADVITRLVLVGASIGTGLAMWLVPGAAIRQPGPLLAGVALFAGSLLAAFGQLSTLRLKLTDLDKAADVAKDLQPYEAAPRSNPHTRDFLDETAAHLLLASYLSAVTAAMLVLGSSVFPRSDGSICGPLAGAIGATSTYVFVLFLIALPRLYVAYTTINVVRKQLSGIGR
jgi:hypothetical protein